MAENHARTQGESILLDVIELKVPQFSKEEGAEEGAILCGVVLWAEGFLHHAWEGVMKQCEKGWGLFYLRPKGNVVYCSLLLDITFSKHTYNFRYCFEGYAYAADSFSEAGQTICCCV